jgi:hypothetical protein
VDASIEQWEALAALLPPDKAAGVVDFVMIGEQEGAIATLVEGLLESGVPTADNVRAEIAVLAEVWGTWNGVEDDVRRCAPDPTGGGCVKLAAEAEIPVPEVSPVVLPWLECALCGGVLHRVGDREFWYVIGADRFELNDPDGTWGYDRDQIWEAFATLHECCEDPNCRLAPWLAWEDGEETDDA